MAGKIIITGPGRAGTTFLLMLLARLGFNTGYEPGQEPYNPDWRAGCEWRVEGEFKPPFTELKQTIADAPQVLKSPEWSLVLKDFVQAGVLDVEHVYLPIRDLDEAAKSRLDVGLFWQVCETDSYEYLLMDQASIHALALGRAVEACLLCHIPYTFLMFPRLVKDARYCYRKMCEGVHLNWEEFEREFKGLARPKQIKWT